MRVELRWKSIQIVRGQVYAGNYLNDEQGKSAGAIYVSEVASVLKQTELWDAIHHSESPNPVLLKGEVLKHHRCIVFYKITACGAM